MDPARAEGPNPGPGLRWDRRLVFFALLGVVMGTVFDALHVWTGTAYYENTFVLPLFHVAWYVPLEFTCGGHRRRDGAAGARRGVSARAALPCRLRSVLLGLGCFAFAWGGSGALTPLLLGRGQALRGALRTRTRCILGILLGSFAGGHVARPSIAPSQGVLDGPLHGRSIGVGVEARLVKLTDTYRYTHPDFLGRPHVVADRSTSSLAERLATSAASSKSPTVRRPEPSPDPSAPISDTA
ncbi:MAG: hypothetical protein V9F03_05255 [Microthrixaceae bacterium]